MEIQLSFSLLSIMPGHRAVVAGAGQRCAGTVRLVVVLLHLAPSLRGPNDEHSTERETQMREWQ
jgi:hypothetical protein